MWIYGTSIKKNVCPDPVWKSVTPWRPRASPPSRKAPRREWIINEQNVYEYEYISIFIIIIIIISSSSSSLSI